MSVDEIYVASAVAGPAPRVYRITPWPIRIVVPLLVIVVIAGLLHGGSLWAVPIPVVSGAAWICAAEWCGLVVSDIGIESRMIRRWNRFRYAWADIGGFELVDSGERVGIAMRLRDGSRKLLPSMRTWFWDKGAVKQIYGS